MNLQLPLKAFLLFFVLALGGGSLQAQTGFFVPVSSASARVAVPPMAQNIARSTLYRLNTAALRTYLTKAPLEFRGNAAPLKLAIPLPDGTAESFAMLESPMLAPTIAAQHPEIKTYIGRGLSHPNYTIRLSFTSSGFDAIILGVAGSSVYYTKTLPNDPTDQQYLLYFAQDVKKSESAPASDSFGQCGTADPAVDIQSVKSGKSERQAATLNNTGTALRTFRLAVAATGQFTQKRGGTVQAAFNSVVNYVNRMNAVYRTELSVTFMLVSGTNTVYTDTTRYTNSDQKNMLTQNQAILDAVIGTANYDVGHVVSYIGGSGGGIASKGSVCVAARKGQGVSGMGNTSYGPIDPVYVSYAPVFDDQLIAHEVGHQFDMSHTFNSVIPVCTTRDSTTSVEPGSGTTIMSYGYTCGNQTGDDYERSTYLPFLNFHTISYDQAANYINTLTCFTSSALNNAVPVINTFPANVTIPKSTPFELTGTATDANSGDVLSYSWEGTNTGGTVIPTATTLLNTALPPFFRSYQPVATGTRTFPRLSAILDGTNFARGDKLPSVGIVTTHRLTVRDNVGGLTYREAAVTIDGNSGPFLETTNLTGSFQGSTQRTITWSVANTTAPPVSCAAVNILLSTDGGLTFPTMLLTNTPNDGTEPVTFPNITTNQARIKVVAANNIFFDISNSNFTIIDPNNKPPVAPAIASQAATVDVPFSFVVPAFTDPENQALTYTATGLPSSLMFNAATRVISGTPTALGVSTVTIVATDPASATASATFTLTANPPAAIPLVVNLVANSLTAVTTGAITLTAVTTGGRPAYRYTFVGSRGYSISTSASGSGNTATFSDLSPGEQTLTVTVTDNTLPVSQTATAMISVTAIAPGATIVQVNSTDPNAAEGRPNATTGARIGVQLKEDTTPNTDNDDPGFIRFQRSDSKGTLVVNYQIGGTATNGVDFVSLPTSVTFADGQTELIEEMDPIDDDIVEGDETVVITLVDAATYHADPNQTTTTLTIHDAPASLTITSFTCNTTNSVLTSVNFVVGYPGGTFTPAVAPLFINGVTDNGQLGVRYTFPFDANGSTLTVQDQGNRRSTYFVWNFRQACTTLTPTPPAPPSPTSLTITSFTCNTTNSVLSSVNFVVGYPNGSFTPAVAPLFINGVTAGGQLGVRYTFPFDANGNTLTVQDNANRSQTYFVWNFRQACTTLTPTPPAPPSPASLTITSFTCNTTNSVLSSVNFVVGYPGGSFTPAVAPLFINGVTVNGQLGVRYTFPFDANGNTLTVQDNANRSQTYFVWNFRQACTTSSLRVGNEQATPWLVSVLGNPPVTDYAEIAVQNAEGRKLLLTISDLSGRDVSAQGVLVSEPVQRVRVHVGPSGGMYLLRVSDGIRQQTVRIVRP